MTDRGPHHHEPHTLENESVRKELKERGYFNQALAPSQLAEQQQKLRIEEINAETEEEIRAEQWLQTFPFGNAVRPSAGPLGETLGDYKRVLRNSGLHKGSLAFSPHNYPAFDSIIMRECGMGKTGVSLSPAFNPNHPAYKDFAPLRRNIAILRNYLLVHYFPDGAYLGNDKSKAGQEDVENFQKIEKMAQTLGKALSGGDGKNSAPVGFLQSISHLLLGEPLSTPNVSDFLTQANVPDKGIQVMYDLLFNKNENKNSWNLPPVNNTAFSDANMQRYNDATMLEACAENCEATARKFNSVSTLDTQQKAVAIDEGKNILEKLKILLAASPDGQEINEIGDPELTKAITMNTAVACMQANLAMLTMENPDKRLNTRLLEEEIKSQVKQAASDMKPQAQTTYAAQDKSNKANTRPKADDRRNMAQRNAATARLATRMQGTLTQIQQIRRSQAITSQATGLTRQRQQTTAPLQPQKTQAIAPPPPPTPGNPNAAAMLALAEHARSVGDTIDGSSATVAAVASKSAQGAAQAAEASQKAAAIRRANQQRLQQQLNAKQAAAAAAAKNQNNR